MEMLETKIKSFLNLGSDGIYDSSSIDSYVYGSAFGYGDFLGCGSGSGSESGAGYTYNAGNSFINETSNGSGYGYGYNYGNGIKEINGNHVYIVDGIQTIIKTIHGNIAQGFVLQIDFTLKLCYIVKEQNKFAHGNTLHDAFAALQEKLYDDSTEEERIEAFRKKFSKYDTPYSNRDLFAYHHVLTGSCRMGREVFCKDKGIDLNGNTTIREFVELTKDSYGSNVIRKLPKVYGQNN